VSSYAELYLHGVQIFSWGNEIDPTFLFLFAREEVRRWIEEASVDNDFEPRERVQLVATASVLRDRLDVLGIGREALNEAFDDYVRDKLRSQRATWDMRESIFRDQLPSIEPRMKAGIELLETLTLDRWATLLALLYSHQTSVSVASHPTRLRLKSCLRCGNMPIRGFYSAWFC
jgi:HEPN/Toprim N-terminal domain 1